ncbi:hypothetical protein HPHPH36_0383 [Helicobacter pylori Hp H-36]|nr:hypothetical protein HPHPH36_0383 [Helicobacter pylori Hp H-36]
MRLVVFFNSFNSWLLAYYKHATNANHTITERYVHDYKKI